MSNRLCASFLVKLISKLPSVSTKSIPKIALIDCHGPPRFMMMDRKTFQSLTRSIFGDTPGFDYNPFKLFS